jgi:hypothetical protein
MNPTCDHGFNSDTDCETCDLIWDEETDIDGFTRHDCDPKNDPGVPTF